MCQLKKCSSCGTEKPLSEFSKRKGTRDGYAYRCKSCLKEYWHNNKDRLNENRKPYMAKYRQRPEVKERSSKRTNEYRQTEKGKLENRQRAKEWNAKNKEEIYQRRKAKIVHSREYLREWRKKNRAQSIEYWHRRKARKLGNGGSYTQQEWIDLCEKFDNICLCCRQSLPLTPDHIVPLSTGGSNSIDNIQPLCLSCNSRKQNKTIDYRPQFKPYS